MGYRVLNEYFAQGEQEKKLGIPVQMLNDRDKVNRPNSQIGFIEFIITPLIAAEVKIFKSWYQTSLLLEENLWNWEAMWIEECNPSKEERGKVNDRVRKMGMKLDNQRFRDCDKELLSQGGELSPSKHSLNSGRTSSKMSKT